MTTLSSTPLVSIITPSFNQGQFIAETLQSVARQTYPAIEHIIMDGGSTDESPAIIQAYAKQHPGTVSWVSEPDHGQADAINKGMKQASGEILAYLNSDDTYAPGAIATVVAFLKEHPEVHLVHGRGLHINPDGATIKLPHLPTHRILAARSVRHHRRI